MACTPLRLPMATRKHQSRYEYLMGWRMGLLQAWLCHAWASAKLTATPPSMSCADQALEILDELVLAGSDGLDMRNREQVRVCKRT